MINLKILSLLVGGLATTGGIVTAIVKSKNSLQPENIKLQTDTDRKIGTLTEPSEKGNNIAQEPESLFDNHLGETGDRNSNDQTNAGQERNNDVSAGSLQHENSRESQRTVGDQHSR